MVTDAQLLLCMLNFVCVEVQIYLYLGVCVEVRLQLLGAGSLLSPCEV